MRLSSLAAGSALIVLLAVSRLEAPALTAVSGVAAGALAALALAHWIAFFVRPRAAKACRTCAARRRAWERRHAWRILKHRLRRWYEGKPATPERAGNCRSCGQKTPLEQMDAQPQAAPGLRHVVEMSREFAVISNRLTQTDPVDSWEADMLHYFVYALRPDATHRPAHALFVARWEDDSPVSASLLIERPHEEPEVHNLTALLRAQG